MDKDALVKAATEWAERETPEHVGNHTRGAILDSEGIERGTLAKLWHADEMTIEPGDGVFVRRDVVEAALSHLAAKLERAEARIAGLRDGLQCVVNDSEASEHSTLRVESMAALADQALTEDDKAAGASQ